MKSIHALLDRLAFWKRIAPEVDPEPEPITIDIRPFGLTTFDTAKQMGRIWLDQMTLLGKPKPKVRILFKCVTEDGIQSVVVTARTPSERGSQFPV